MNRTADSPRGLRRLYDKLLGWSASPSGVRVLAVISFVEASVFPIPPDVFLTVTVLAKPKVWFRAASVCSIASILGGAAGYLIGWGVWEVVDEFFFRYVPGFSPEAYAKMSTLYEDWNFWVVFVAGFTPIPYKLFTIAAGVAKIGFPIFLLASAVSRSARFFLVAGLIRRFGPQVKPLIERHFGWFTMLFALLLIGGFVVAKLLLK